MDPVVTSTETPAPAAPAAPAAVVASTPVTGTDVLKSMNESERAEWRKTGELPAAKTPKFDADPASSPGKPAAQAAERAASTEAESQPAAAVVEKPKANAETRIKELLEENKRLKDAAAKPPSAPQVQTPSAASSPAPAALGPKPDPTDYTKYPLGTSDPNYVEDTARHMAQALLHEERTKAAEADAQARHQAENQRIATAWSEKVQAVKTKHPDAEEKFTQPIKIQAGSAMDAWILESDYGPETLYHLYDHPDELARISALPPIQQLEAMVLLGHGLVTAAPPVKTKTTAPDPPTTLAARATAQTDEAEAALARGDFRAYNRITTERELAKLGKK